MDIFAWQTFNSLPNDVLEHLILAKLPVHSLVACCFVSKRLKEYAYRFLNTDKYRDKKCERSADLNDRDNHCQRQQKELRKSLFATGVRIYFLKWYENNLRYPFCPSEELEVAAKGEKKRKKKNKATTKKTKKWM